MSGADRAIGHITRFTHFRPSDRRYPPDTPVGFRARGRRPILSGYKKILRPKTCLTPVGSSSHSPNR